MKKLNSVSKSKEKTVYSISYAEFISGSWLKLIPNGSRVRVEWTSGKGVLIIENTPRLQFKEYREDEK